MEKNYLEEKLRKDIFKEVAEYIGYVYADDYHTNDKLIVNEFDYSVSHGRRNYEDLEKGYGYFDMFHLIKRDGTFTFAADPVGIECVVMHYFPNKKVDGLVENMKNAINAFLQKYGYKSSAKLILPFSNYEPLVDDVSLKSKNGLIEVMEDEYGNDGYEEFELRKCVRNTKSKGLVINEDNLQKFTVGILLNYGMKA